MAVAIECCPMDYVIAENKVRLMQFILYHKWSKVVNSGIPYRTERLCSFAKGFARMVPSKENFFLTSGASVQRKTAQ